MGEVGAVVLGAGSVGLGVIRSLGEKGIRMVVVDDHDYDAGFYSKFIEDSFFCSGRAKIISALLGLGLEKRGWILIPTKDFHVALVSKNWKILSKYFTLTTPPWTIIRYCIDKLLTYKIAEETEIPIPQTFCPRNKKELKEISDHMDFKRKTWILKPRSRRLFSRKPDDLFYKLKAVGIRSKNDLLRLYSENLEMTGESVLIQERIPGMPDRNVILRMVLNRQSKPVVMLTDRKIRQRPLFFGVGTCRESIYAPEAARLGLKLLSAIKYYGMAYVEFKKDPRDGKLKLIEVNPRFTAGVSLAKACGINLPYTLYNTFLDNQVEVCRKFATGVRWWSIGADLSTIFRNRWFLPWRKTVGDIVANAGRIKAFEYFSIKDPVPFSVPLIRSLCERFQILRNRTH